MKSLTDYWSEKCDRETIQKQVDLDRMKNIRQKDLEKYQNLLRTVFESSDEGHFALCFKLTGFQVQRVRENRNRRPK
jgi:hypothetical protein